VVPESFTPDTAFMLGEAPGVKNFFVGCGMNSVGIQSAGGVGRALSHWIVDGHPEEQLWPVDVKRYFPWQQNIRYLHDRIVEAVGVLYHHHYPNRQRDTARPVICSPIHDRNGPTGLPPKASTRFMSTAGKSPTGSNTSKRNTWPFGKGLVYMI
jgi:4-methylaminobutanoate oxidase (formaldehyde-forming)